MEVFHSHSEEEAKRLHHMFPQKPMEPLMLEQQREFVRVRECHICLERFQPWNTIVRDHCHHTGKYRGSTHQKCNLQYAIPHYIPVVFHNLSGYNIHLFIRELRKKVCSGSIDVTAKNLEKYISFNVSIAIGKYETPLGETKQIMRQLQFIDSVRFMVCSLELLSKNLVGTNRMTCEECGSETELTHIDENYCHHLWNVHQVLRCESSEVRD